MLLLLGVASLMCRSDSIVFELPGSCVLTMDGLASPIFFTYRPSVATLGHIPFHLEVYGSSRACTIIITHWMLTKT